MVQRIEEVSGDDELLERLARFDILTGDELDMKMDFADPLNYGLLGLAQGPHLLTLFRPQLADLDPPAATELPAGVTDAVLEDAEVDVIGVDMVATDWLETLSLDTCIDFKRVREANTHTSTVRGDDRGVFHGGSIDCVNHEDISKRSPYKSDLDRSRNDGPLHTDRFNYRDCNDCDR